MKRLITSVAVHRPAGSEVLPAGAVLDDDDAALITNPACWEESDSVDSAEQDAEEDHEDFGEAPDDSWSKQRIMDWAAAHGIDLGAAKTKADMLMIIRDAADVDAQETAVEDDSDVEFVG